MRASIAPEVAPFGAGVWPELADPERDNEAINAGMVWLNTQALYGSVADLYLESLGLDLEALPDPLEPGQALRCLRWGIYTGDRMVPVQDRLYPVLVAALTKGGHEFRGAHLTWLDRNGTGLAPISAARTVMGDMAGTACRVVPAGRELGLAQSVEAALAIWKITGMPCWFVPTLAGFGEVELPPIVKTVVICAEHSASDLDRYKIDQATKRISALGREVKVFRPPQKDWTFLKWMGAAGDADT